jgi:predicted aminopeptidase
LKLALAGLAALCLSGCSPVYVMKAAAGHTSLLVHRRSIEKTVKDPKTAEETRAKLALVLEVREFAFSELHLKKSSDYTTWTPVKGDVLTWLVEAAPKLALEPYIFKFPLIGGFPYKGYFKRADAEAEAKTLEAKGYDVTIQGASAYKTPLWISDPLPSSVLAYPPGELASLLIHELTHGTVFFKDQTQFDETLAEFSGQTGARLFLEKKYGKDSKELAAFSKSLDDEKKASAVFDSLYAELDAVYKSTAAVETKLTARERVFALGLDRLKQAGFEYKKLNNAVVLAHRVYHDETNRRRLELAFEQTRGDWAAFIALLKSLDPKDPAGDLAKRPELRRP